MKTMKKVISALLLVCMLMSLCAVGAYAEGETITIDVPSVKSTENVKATATISATDAAEYTITWHWTEGEEAKSWTAAKGVMNVEWTAGELPDNCSIYATATKGEEAGTIKSETKNVKLIYAVTGVTLEPTATSLTKGSSVTLTATVSPDNATNKTITWTANPDNLVDITAEGVVTVKSGATITDGATVSITATADGVTSSAAEITLSNSPAAPAPVTATLDSVSITDNGNGTFTAEPKFNNTVDESVLSAVTYKWELATVDKVTVNGSTSKTVEFVNGDTAEKAISFKVTATYNGDSKEATGTYTLPAKSTAKTMTLSVNSSELFAGGNTYTLSALDGGTAITDKTVNYSVESGPASVSGSTLTTGAYGGTVVVNASCDGYTPASLTLTVKDGITLKAAPDTLTIGSSSNTSKLTAYYNGKSEAISGVTWKEVSTSSANVATLDASTGVVTAGSAAGTVKYHAVIDGHEITSVDVTVTVRANNIIEFDVAGFYNSVSSFTVTAKGGVLQLVASNARLKSNPSVSIPGTFNFNWVPATGDPSNGIEVTNLGSGKATAYGRYNGSYSLAVTFTPNDTATYPVTTQNHTVIVNYTPSIIKGNYGVWDGTNGLDFLVNDHISNWSGQVWVDGNLLSDANYVCRGSSDGQIWVTLTPAFISWLRQYYNGNGIHTITVGVDGRNAATGYFKTWGTASSFNGVKTGDDANLGLWAALLGVSAVGAAAAVVIYKRKKANG